MKNAPLIDFDSVAHLVALRQALPTAPKDPLPGDTFLSPAKANIPDLIYTPREVVGFTYMREEKRIEYALLPRMCFETVRRGANRPDHPDTVRMEGLFTDAICEVFAGLPSDKIAQLGNRMNRTSDSVYLKRKGGWFDDNWTNGKIAMCLYCLACDLTHDGYELHPESALAEGLMMMRSTFEDEAAAIPERWLSAQDQAVKFRRFLQKRGFFK